MRTFVRVLAGLSLGVGLLLSLAGLAALPAGGLLFALPFVFLIPGVALTIAGALGLFLSREHPPGQTTGQ